MTRDYPCGCSIMGPDLAMLPARCPAHLGAHMVIQRLAVWLVRRGTWWPIQVDTIWTTEADARARAAARGPEWHVMKYWTIPPDTPDKAGLMRPVLGVDWGSGESWTAVTPGGRAELIAVLRARADDLERHPNWSAARAIGTMRAAAEALETPAVEVCADCGGRGEVLDAPSHVLDGRTYWTPCPSCGSGRS